LGFDADRNAPNRPPGHFETLHREKMLRLPMRPDLKELFLREREQLVLGHRDDLKSFIDLIDADEGRM
jgi:hypothetical protein